MKKTIFSIILIVSLFVFIPSFNAMQVFVEKTIGDSLTLEVESSDTIEAVKAKIYSLDNTLLPENQILFFDGTELEDGRTLADYNVQKENTLQVLLKEVKYKVIFDANEGEFKDGNYLVIDEWKNGMESTLEFPTREGYDFIGFYTAKNEGTKLELILAESGIDKDMTFYAQWEERAECPQTFDSIVLNIIFFAVSLILLCITIYLYHGKKELN